METANLVNNALAPEMGLTDVASVLTQLEQESWHPDIAEELNVLGGIARLHDAPGKDVPFVEIFEHRVDGTLRHCQYTEVEQGLLERLQAHLEHAVLRARINDILHGMRPNHLLAREAVRQYMVFALLQESQVNQAYHEGTVAWARAADLSRRLGKKATLHSEVLDGIEAALTRHEDDDQQGQYSFRLIEVLFEFRRGDPLRYAALSETLALRAGSVGNLPMASRHWGQSARWHRIAGDPVQETSARIQAAEVLVTDALNNAKAGMQPYLVSLDLTRAFKLLRESGADPARIVEVHRQLRELQQTPPEGMKQLVIDIDPEDINRLRQFGRVAVAGKGDLEVLSSLAGLMMMVPRATMQQQVRQQLDATVMWRLATYSIQDREGRTQPAPQTEEEHLEHEIFQQQDACRFLIVHQLEAAMIQICSEGSLTPETLKALVQNHPLIPRGHRASVLRGLVAGLEDDFLVVVPILIPQIEAIFRHVLTTRGVVTSGLDSSGVQQEHNLNAFLTEPDDLGVLSTVFEETLLFDLRGLLVEKSGRNLRNMMAHGLTTDAEVDGPTARYVWALVIQILMSTGNESQSFSELD